MPQIVGQGRPASNSSPSFAHSALAILIVACVAQYFFHTARSPDSRLGAATRLIARADGDIHEKNAGHTAPPRQRRCVPPRDQALGKFAVGMSISRTKVWQHNYAMRAVEHRQSDCDLFNQDKLKTHPNERPLARTRASGPRKQTVALTATNRIDWTH